MNEKPNKLTEKMKRAAAIVFLVAATGGMTMIASAPAQASAVEDLKTEIDKVDGIFDTVKDPVVASMAFAAGAMLIKRIVYA
jgi:hypothetical protein